MLKPRENFSLRSFFPTNNSRGDCPEMDTITADSVRDQLMTNNPEFRELVREHGRYEERLSELSALAYPSDEEQLEETTLKKKKLALKDQMYSLMLDYEKRATTEH